MEPVLWDTSVQVGDILLEAIERLPSEVDGAVILWTPDISGERRGVRLLAPVTNVVFEYGYLAARLTRKRVAICQFGDVTSPSDVNGITKVVVPSYLKDEKGEPLPLPEKPTKHLRSWLEQLSPLADGMRPTSRVHGYSGCWMVQNHFNLWHGIKLKQNDRVFFDGKTFLRLRDDGEEGYGTQIGQLKVTLDQYSATWDIANEVVTAAVDKKGSLKMRVKVRVRELLDETGVPPSDRVREKLPSPEWDLVLKRVPGEPKMLKGTHTYKVATVIYSRAREDYTYTGV